MPSTGITATFGRSSEGAGSLFLPLSPVRPAVDTDTCASYTGAVMPKEEQHSDKPAKTVQGSVRIQATGNMTVTGHVRPRLVPDIQELKKAVSVDELKKQGFTANLPRTIEIVPSTDNSGASALDVTVIFPNTMGDKDVTSAQTSRMLSWIQDTILSKAESDGRWPYVFVKVEGKDVCPA
jgi:hypothetical protein